MRVRTQEEDVVEMGVVPGHTTDRDGTSGARRRGHRVPHRAFEGNQTGEGWAPSVPFNLDTAVAGSGLNGRLAGGTDRPELGGGTQVVKEVEELADGDEEEELLRDA